MEILISGASAGIGWEIAKSCLEENHSVVGLARDFSNTPVYEHFHPVIIDLLQINQIKTLHVYKPDVIICNVGKALLGNLDSYSHQEIQETLHLNFLSHVHLVKILLPQMKKKKSGHLIFIGSESAFQGRRKGSVYCASKFALRGFAQALREECRSSNILVSEVHPGVVKETRFFKETEWEASEKALSPSSVAKEVLETIKNPIECKKVGHFTTGVKKKSYAG